MAAEVAGAGQPAAAGSMSVEELRAAAGPYAPMLDMSNQGRQVELFERATACLYGDARGSAMNPVEFRQANAALTALKSHPEGWRLVPKIVLQARTERAREAGVQILEEAVRHRWGRLKKEERQGARGFVLQRLTECCKSEETLTQHQGLLYRLNMTLVEIVKHDWPHAWPTFISDLVQAAAKSTQLCQNNMKLLGLLSEDVFSHARVVSTGITSRRGAEMQAKLTTEFAAIYRMCEAVLAKSTHVPLLTETLRALQKFLTWIPEGYVFSTKLVEVLCKKFLPSPAYRNLTLQCLAEVAGMEEGHKSPRVIAGMFQLTLRHIATVIPPSTDIERAYGMALQANAGAHVDLVHWLSLFLTTLLKTHLPMLEAAPEASQGFQLLMGALNYLVRTSLVQDKEIFKTCLEFWHFLGRSVYESALADMKAQQLPGYNPSASAVGGAAAGGGAPGSPATYCARCRKYAPVFAEVRKVLIARMAKPEEVLVEENDAGDIVRIQQRNTDELVLYRDMREVFVYLTHMDVKATRQLVLDKLDKQVDGSEWSWEGLNRLCWAIGAISGTMQQEEEKDFLVTIIKDLLQLVDKRRGKNNKAVVASNIMYVVGQYPRFLQGHWRFLKTVVLKLFEFMHELHPGVQDMAVDTFLKISKACRHSFVQRHEGEEHTFIEELNRILPQVVSDLEAHQTQTFFEAAGYMIRANPNRQAQAALVRGLMASPNAFWKGAMRAAEQRVDSLRVPGTIRDLHRCLQTNERACRAVGPAFSQQMSQIFLDMMGVYNAYSKIVQTACQQHGSEVASRMPDIRQMRAVKAAVLDLTRTFVQKSANADTVATHFVPRLLEPLVQDFQASAAAVREPGILALFAAITYRLKDQGQQFASAALQGVFPAAEPMITGGGAEYPEVRRQFYRLLTAITSKCFPALFQVSTELQTKLVEVILSAVRHDEPLVAEIGLELLLEFLGKVQRLRAEARAGFHKTSFMRIALALLGVLTDRLHRGQFTQQVSVLRHLMQALRSGEASTPLYDAGDSLVAGATAAEAAAARQSGHAPPSALSNVGYVTYALQCWIQRTFPNISQPSATDFVAKLTNPGAAVAAARAGRGDAAAAGGDGAEARGAEDGYRTAVRDFLIEVLQWRTAEDQAELYEEENADKTRVQVEEAMRRRQAVPGLAGRAAGGLVNPNAVQDVEQGLDDDSDDDDV